MLLADFSTISYYAMRMLTLKTPLLFVAGIFVLIGLAFPAGNVDAYSYPGFKWSGTSTGYYLNVAGWSHLPIHYAKDAWNGAGSSFHFNYLGMTADPLRKDGRNLVTRANRGVNGDKAFTSVWCNGAGYACYSGRTIIESDVEFNDYFPWGAYGEPNLYDLESAAVHEFGHWLHLGHSSSWCGLSNEASMCTGLGLGELRKRTLAGDDKNGIKYIY